VSRGVAAALLAALCGCDAGLGPPGEWQPIESIDGPLAAEVGTAASPATASGPELRVVTFNVALGGDVDGLAREIAARPELASAAALLLQEEESHTAEPGCRAGRLAAALGLAYVYVPARLIDGGTHGLAVLSPWTIDEVERMDLPLSDVAAQRIAVRATILVGDRRLTVIDVHLGSVLNVTDRILQLRPAVIDAPDPVLVAGDFNTNPYLWDQGAVPVVPASVIADTDQAPILDDYMRALGFDTPTIDLGPTERKFGIESRLDAVYSRGLEVTPGAVVRDVDVSDHWPLWVDVAVP